MSFEQIIDKHIFVYASFLSNLVIVLEKLLEAFDLFRI